MTFTSSPRLNSFSGNRLKRLLMLTTVTGFLICSGNAHAQVSSREGIALQNQIAELQQQIAQLQSSHGKSGTLAAPVSSGHASSSGNSDLTAQLLERVSSLEDDVRTLRGEVDELTNKVNEQNAALNKQIEDMSFAMQNGAKSGSAAPAGDTTSPAPAASPATSDATSSQPLTADGHLKAGQAALKTHDYAEAQSQAEAALAHASGSFKIDAQFLKAQSLAGQKQYRESAVAYYDAYRQSPKSGRAPDALLGVSASLLALGDKKAACQALGKLKSEFPTPSPSIEKSEKIFSERGGC